jgi:very-short-patch-repair endonuclease
MANWTPRVGQERQKERRRDGARAKRMRHDPTRAETALWKLLRALNREGGRFRRQIMLDRLVFDFGDLTARLLIEVDGGVHLRVPQVAERDAAKSAWALANRFRLLRFTNEQVLGDPDFVVTSIRSAHSETLHD